MLKFIKKIFKSHSERIIADLRSQVQLMQDAAAEFTKMSNSQLRDKTQEFKNMVANNAPLETIQYKAFALVREAARRTIGIQHYDEQLIGGLLLHQGKVVEMNTGEGKTLVATLPSYLNAISGKGVHVVTVNDYLAQRDSDWMGKIHRFLGLTVGCITSNIDNYKRKLAYNNDITYITNNELGFDFLRDNMQFSSKDKVQRAHDYAIIDEIDSILIDEARTPLIISGPVNDNTSLYPTINNFITKLSEEDFEKDEKMRAVALTEKGIIKIENMLSESGLITSNNENLYDFENMHLIHYINQSLKAHTLFRRNVDYLVKDGKVVIIDEFTGRTMDSRRYSEGLHQALEAKEKVAIQDENQTLASITFQNYFRMYKKLSGMTGTAMTEATELKETYNLEVVSVPTHNPVRRKDYDDEIYSTKADKYKAIVDLITKCQAKGQPVLVGTVSIEKSEELSKILRKNKIVHNVLNAKHHDKEALIITQAGRFGAVTIATNMAGRGTDIMLGGNAEMLLVDSEKLSSEEYKVQLQSIQAEVDKEKEKVLEAGGLFVIGTERHESRRIDNQLRGRAGRQGDPGETKFFLSLEDDLMRIFASDRMASVLRNMGLKDNEAIHHPLINRSLAIAQLKIETQNYEIRKNLLKYDDVMNDQRTVIYKQRNEAMESNDINNMLFNITEQIIIDMVDSYMPLNSYKEDWNIAEIIKKYQYIFNIHFTTESLEHISGHEDMVKYLTDAAFSIYKKLLRENEEQSVNESIKFLFIKSLDQAWKEHLYALDHLKQGISLRAYGQKDPLNEYKREAFFLFESMLNNLKYSFIQLVVRLQIDRTNTNAKNIIELDKANSNVTSLVPDEPQKLQDKDKIDWQNISRNQLCLCNSGKKFKHCHGALLK